MKIPFDMTLLSHLRQINAKTQSWIDESPNTRFAGLLTEDLNHWQGYGVNTPEELDKYLDNEDAAYAAKCARRDYFYGE